MSECKMCMGSCMVETSCPDKEMGCAVYHMKACPECSPDKHTARADQAAIEKALAPSPWISVTDRLPEGGEEYWVAFKMVGADRTMTDKAFLGRATKDWYFQNLKAGEVKVTHWQPLPEPPE